MCLCFWGHPVHPGSHQLVVMQTTCICVYCMQATVLKKVEFYIDYAQRRHIKNVTDGAGMRLRTSWGAVGENSFKVRGTFHALRQGRPRNLHVMMRRTGRRSWSKHARECGVPKSVMLLGTAAYPALSTLCRADRVARSFACACDAGMLMPSFRLCLRSWSSLPPPDHSPQLRPQLR